MKRIIKAVVPLPPSLNRLYHSWRGRMVKSKEGKDYKENLRHRLCVNENIRPYEGPVHIKMEFFRARKSGDLDNFLKCFLDSLTGIVYVDDSQIVSMAVKRNDDKTNPRVEFTVYGT